MDYVETSNEFYRAVNADPAVAYFVGQTIGAFIVISEPNNEREVKAAAALMEDTVPKLRERMPAHLFDFFVQTIGVIAEQTRNAIARGEIIFPAETAH